MATSIIKDSLYSSQYYKAGDSFSSRSWRAMGRVINSGKGIYCWIDFAKPIFATGATFSITSALAFGNTPTPIFTGAVSTISVSGNELIFVLETSNTLTAGAIYLVEMSGTSITLT